MIQLFPPPPGYVPQSVGESLLVAAGGLVLAIVALICVYGRRKQ